MRLQFKKTKGHKMFFVQKRDIQNMRIPYGNKLPRLKNIYIYISSVEFGIPLTKPGDMGHIRSKYGNGMA